LVRTPESWDRELTDSHRRTSKSALQVFIRNEAPDHPLDILVGV
jgi:hypothetical protein